MQTPLAVAAEPVPAPRVFSQLPEHSRSSAHASPFFFGAAHVPAMHRASLAHAPCEQACPTPGSGALEHFLSTHRRSSPHSRLVSQRPPIGTSASHRRPLQCPAHSGCFRSTSICRVWLASVSIPRLQAPAVFGFPQRPVSLAATPWHRIPSSHSSDDRHRSPSFIAPFTIPTHAAGAFAESGVTQSHPSYAFAEASAQRSTSAGSITIAFDRRANDSTREHSSTIVIPGSPPQHSAFRFAGSAWTTSQNRAARGSGAPPVLG